MTRHRTKPLLAAVFLLGGVAMYFGYPGPRGDRAFVLGCVIVFEAVILTALYFGRIVHCPQCDADMGYFEGGGPFRRLYQPVPRYISCKRCGCTLDRWNNNRPLRKP